MLSVDEARSRILDAVSVMQPETIALDNALGRVLAEGVMARVTHPPVAVSAMDGYAVRAEDVAASGKPLTVVGESAAGHPYTGPVPDGAAVRIFTGAQVPDGLNTILIQEDAERAGDIVTARDAVPSGKFVRSAGLDFKEGDAGPCAGTVLGSRDIALIAAMNVPWLTVFRRPRVGILSTGDEIALPGEPLGDAGIVGSNGPGLAAFVRSVGGDPVMLGIAKDTTDDLAAKLGSAKGCDAIVTTGGASVGDHDLVQGVLKDIGATLGFYKIAMRPGKPLMFGTLKGVPVLGLPGNPVSAMVTALLFLGPAMRKAQGIEAVGPITEAVPLAADVPANDHREDYLRATLEHNASGAVVVRSFPRQDSSMLATLTRADALIIRPANAPAATAGDTVPVIRLTS